MAVPPFEGETFLAFMDISGFKKYMKSNKAIKVLDSLHSHGYDIIEPDGDISAILVSDSCILFVNKELELPQYNENIEFYLSLLLDKVKDLNKKLIRSEEKIMLTTSIAYGNFRYEQRIEFNPIEKNHFFGDAYIDAFSDNEYNNKKLNPGQCRLLIKHLPGRLKTYLENPENSGSIPYKNLKLLRKKGNFYYFYWMLKNSDDIPVFEKDYNEAYNSRYVLLKELLNKE